MLTVTSDSNGHRKLRSKNRDEIRQLDTRFIFQASFT